MAIRLSEARYAEEPQSATDTCLWDGKSVIIETCLMDNTYNSESTFVVIFKYFSLLY